MRLTKFLQVTSLRNHFIIGLALMSFSANAGWELTWVDRFDGTGVNWDNWTAQTQANYNNEVQCYTDDESSAQRNYEVSDGTLKITARRMDIACPGLGGEQRTWTSGRLNSKDKAEFLYGRVEARLRFLNLEGGSWPAFWMLENRIAEQPYKGDNDFVNWPNPGAGEIDVWEWYGNSGASYITNFFNVASCGGEFRPDYPGGVTDVTEFNTYAMEWTPDSVAFYMNDTLVVQHDMSNCSQYEEPMFVLINVAMGGNLGGNIDPALNQATMEVDYVAHCTRSTANSETGCNESSPVLQDADGDGVSDSVDQCPNTPAGATVDFNGCQIQTEPLAGASAPVEPEENVISLYSDSYTNITGIDYNPDWGQATAVSEVDLAGNSVLKYEGLNYQGTDFDSNRQDVSELDFFHVDYWTYNADSLRIYLISPGPVETPYDFAVQKQSWQRYKIPLSHFVNVDLTNTFQLKVEGNGDVYLDNIYFSGESESNLAPVASLSATQNGSSISEIVPDNGTVNVAVSISDPNTTDSHTVAWQVTGVSSFSEQALSIAIEPSEITGSNVTVTVNVTDNGSPTLTAENSLNLTVQTQTPTTPAPTTPVTPTPDNDASGGSIGVLLGVLLLAVSRRRLCTLR
ncbi:family 16 glycosylhydrolase [Alteromonas sp. ASW11-36]|uniref:Family 16 glycosylhydrolase n=1 Tax=Alteromonas arenosi TaxID=3055817 RepID=A0ABT7SWS3_9ALTE|nr:family 16 glycosylhydrolase [Alteromonas sp. ASW11-36]MDM7860638.1 family 16 glycosylhydrolase [Alteromonas sp. ASW11-36]